MEAADASSIIPLCINKSHSINEVIPKGAAPVPFRTVRPADINETRAPNKLNTTVILRYEKVIRIQNLKYFVCTLFV